MDGTQMFPLAISCGNTFILKPSERDPGASMLLAKLAEEAGVPPGVLNIIHGSKVANLEQQRNQHNNNK